MDAAGQKHRSWIGRSQCGLEIGDREGPTLAIGAEEGHVPDAVNQVRVGKASTYALPQRLYPQLYPLWDGKGPSGRIQELRDHT